MSTTQTTSTQAQPAGNFTITKAMIDSYCSTGLTVEEMAEQITTVSGIKCSVGVVRKAAKKYAIALRNKPKKSPFSFDEAPAGVAAIVAPTVSATIEG